MYCVGENSTTQIDLAVLPSERERVLLALPDPHGVGLVEQLLLLVLRHLERLDPAQRVAVPVRVALRLLE